jgi:hypothetical protein
MRRRDGVVQLHELFCALDVCVFVFVFGFGSVGCRGRGGGCGARGDEGKGCGGVADAEGDEVGEEVGELGGSAGLGLGLGLGLGRMCMWRDDGWEWGCAALRPRHGRGPEMRCDRERDRRQWPTVLSFPRPPIEIYIFTRFFRSCIYWYRHGGEYAVYQGGMPEGTLPLRCVVVPRGWSMR